MKVTNNKEHLPYLFRIMKPLFACVLMSGIAMLFSARLAAGGWEVSPNVLVKGTYTDNADLSSSGKKSGFYTQVTPGVAIAREGAGRVQLNANYALTYTGNRPGNRGRTIAHSLASKMQAELYEDVIFLDASAGANLGSATSGGQRGDDSVGDIRDPIQTYTYSLTPYFKSHLGRYADFLARYTFDQVINSGKGGLDSYSNQALLSINSSSYFTRFPWGLSYQQKKIGNESGVTDSETKTINTNVSYVFSRKWRINLTGGKVDYDIQSRRSSTDSSTWSAGATWTPSVRTNMDFSYGRQMFGQNIVFDFNHRWRRAVWRASYNKTLTDSRTQQLARGFSDQFAYATPQGTSYLFQDKYTHTLYRSGVDANGNPVYIYKGEYDYATLAAEYYVMEILSTGFTLNTRRSDFSVDAHVTRREYEVSKNQGRDIGINTSWSRRLTSKTDLKVAASWQKNRANENATENTRWRLSVGLSKKLTQHTSANLDYKHNRLDSTGSTDEYRENQLSLSLASKW